MPRLQRISSSKALSLLSEMRERTVRGASRFGVYFSPQEDAEMVGDVYK